MEENDSPIFLEFSRVLALAGLLLLTILATLVQAQTKGWEREWNETLAAAKKEGTVVVMGSPNPVMRNDVIPGFMSRYGIPVEFVAARGGELLTKIRAERTAGIYSTDVFMAGGIDPAANVLYPEKLIDPLRPMLVVPEIIDSSKWKRGSLWFVDPQENFVLRVFNSVRTLLHINTEFLRPEEIRSAKDLLNPKWKGKISTEDPTIVGSSAAQATQFYVQLGEEFVRRLYLEQKPVYGRDKRQLSDWLARGTYPICLGCHENDVRDLVREGFKIVTLYELSDVQGTIGGAPLFPTVMNRAPHSNAAKVFVNWMVSREALEIYSRGYGYATLRNDVDESFLEPGTIPRPGVKYFDDSDWKWAVTGRKEARDRVSKILRSR